MIDSFSGEYEFLSNFAPSVVIYNGEEYATVEHAYQAAKSLSPAVRWHVQCAKTPHEAKRRGRKLLLRDDWEQVKNMVMYALLCEKFTATNELGRKLISTHPHELVEGNYWGDKYWGVCNGVGQNWLGTLLMARRNELMLWS